MSTSRKLSHTTTQKKENPIWGCNSRATDDFATRVSFVRSILSPPFLNPPKFSVLHTLPRSRQRTLRPLIPSANISGMESVRSEYIGPYLVPSPPTPPPNTPANQHLPYNSTFWRTRVRKSTRSPAVASFAATRTDFKKQALQHEAPTADPRTCQKGAVLTRPAVIHASLFYWWRLVEGGCITAVGWGSRRLDFVFSQFSDERSLFYERRWLFRSESFLFFLQRSHLELACHLLLLLLLPIHLQFELKEESKRAQGSGKGREGVAIGGMGF